MSKVARHRAMSPRTNEMSSSSVAVAPSIMLRVCMPSRRARIMLAARGNVKAARAFFHESILSRVGARAARFFSFSAACVLEAKMARECPSLRVFRGPARAPPIKARRRSLALAGSKLAGDVAGDRWSRGR